jgi:hypothetical protein
MVQLEIVARWGALGFLIALAVVVFFKMLTGFIPIGGLLTGEHKDGTAYFSVGRTQLLFFTVITAANYLRQLATSSSLTSLPDVSTGMLVILSVSELSYLVGKARALLFGPSVTSSQKGNKS